MFHHPNDVASLKSNRHFRLPAVGRALAHRNFRLFITGQGISVIGTWMQQIATMWLVYRLSQSSFLLGLTDFASQFPGALFLPLAGVFADRWNRRSIVITTQTLAMIQAFALLALTLTGVISVWQIIVLGVLLGIVNAFDSTTRQSFLVQMVDRQEDLPNAIALNSSVFNGGRLLGPALAGFVIGAFGESPCFLLNGISYLAVLGMLLAIRVRPNIASASDLSIAKGLNEGLRYVAGSMPIRTLLLLLGIVNMMVAPLTVLMPLLAADVLHGSSHTLGLLTSALGIGALSASLFLAARKSVVGLGRVIAVATAVLGLGLAGISFSHTVWVSMLLLVVTGFAMVTQMASSNALLQTIVDEKERGRVMSFYTLTFFGMGPLGSLLFGSLASMLGTTNAFLISGLGCLAGSLAFTALLPQLCRATWSILVQNGTLSEMPVPVSFADSSVESCSATRRSAA